MARSTTRLHRLKPPEWSENLPCVALYRVAGSSSTPGAKTGASSVSLSTQAILTASQPATLLKCKLREGWSEYRGSQVFRVLKKRQESPMTKFSPGSLV